MDGLRCSALVLLLLLTSVTYFSISTDNVDGGVFGPSPIGEWFLDEGSGQYARDNTGNGNHFVLGGSTSTQSSDPTWGSGLNGSCLKFNGYNDYAMVGSSAMMDLTGDLSMETWFKTDSTAPYLAILDKMYGQGTSTGYTFYLNDGKPRLSLYDGGTGSNIGGTVDLRDNEWHHVIITYDGSEGKVYIDGEWNFTKSMTKDSTSSNTRLTLGLRSSGWGGYMPFKGDIDQVAIFDRALSASEVKFRYTGHIPQHSFWPLDENEGQEASDIISGNDGFLGTTGGSDDQDPEWYIGMNGSCTRFDGVDDIIRIPVKDLGISNTFTISMWIWTDDIVSEQDLFTHSEFINGTWISWFRLSIKDQKLIANGRWDGESNSNPGNFPNADGGEFVSTRKIPLARWTNVMYVSNDENGKSYLYINGVSSGSVVGTYPELTVRPNWNMGNSGQNNYPFKGCVDEVDVWNYGLSNSQVSEIYNSVEVNERAPTKPISVVADAGDGFVVITWSPPDDIGTSLLSNYRILRGDDPGLMQFHSGVNSNIFSFNDTDVVNGVTYHYIIRALNAIGESPDSDMVHATPMGLPSEPWNLKIRSGDEFCHLTWSPPLYDGGADIIVYIIERDNGTGFEFLLNVTSDVLDMNDTDVLNGKEYGYRIRAINMIGDGPLSPASYGYPLAIPDPPVDLVQKTGDSFVHLEWSASVDDGGTPIFAYQLFRGSDPDGEFHLVWSLNGEGRSYNDTDVQNGESYYYYIRCFNSVGGSFNSNMVMAIPMTVPSEPNDLEIAYGDSFIILDWKQPDDDGGDPVEGYVVMRMEAYGEWDEIYRPGSGRSSYNDTDVINGQRYSYRICAFNSVGSSRYTDEVEEVPRTVPGVPEHLSLFSGNSFIHLFWNLSDDDGGNSVVSIQLFLVEGTNDLILLTVLDPHVNEYNHTSLVNGQTYRYVLTAVNDEGPSDPTIPIGGKPLSRPGQVMDISSISGNRFVLIKWNEPADDGGTEITDFEVYRYMPGVEEPTLIVLLGPGARDYNDTNVFNGKDYKYFVIAKNDVGSGPSSLEVLGNPRSDDTSGSLSLLLLIGIIAAIVILIIVIVVVLLFVLLRRGSKDEDVIKEEVYTPAGPVLGPALKPAVLGPAPTAQGELQPMVVPRVLPPAQYVQQPVTPVGSFQPAPLTIMNPVDGFVRNEPSIDTTTSPPVQQPSVAMPQPPPPVQQVQPTVNTPSATATVQGPDGPVNNDLSSPSQQKPQTELPEN